MIMGVIGVRQMRALLPNRVTTFVWLLVVCVMTAQLAPATASAAAGMYLTATTTGRDVTVSVRISPSSAATVVEATIGYDAALLKYVGIRADESPFATAIQQRVHDANVTIARATFNSDGVASDALIAHIVFKTRQESGVTPVSLLAGSASYKGVSLQPPLRGVDVALNAAQCPGRLPQVGVCVMAPTTGAGQQGLHRGQVAQQFIVTPELVDTTTVTTGKNTASPVVTMEGAQYTTLTIKASTAIQSSVAMRYGTSRDALLTRTQPTEPATLHTIVVNKGLTPGSTLYYQLVATNGGVEYRGEVRLVTLRGIPVRLTLLDQTMRPVRHAEVKLVPSDRAARSGDDGVVVFENVAPADYTIEMTADGTTYRQHVPVTAAIEIDSLGVQSAKEQQAAVVFDGYRQPSMAMMWYGMSALGAGGVAAAVWLIVRRRQIVKAGVATQRIHEKRRHEDE